MVVTRQVTPEINMARDASRIGMLPSRAPPVEISPPATANTMAARPAITNPIRYDRCSQLIDSSLSRKAGPEWYRRLAPTGHLSWTEKAPARRGMVAGRGKLSRAAPEWHELVLRQGLRTVLSVPLLREDEAIGALPCPPVVCCEPSTTRALHSLHQEAVAHALPWRFEGSPPSLHGRERPNARAGGKLQRKSIFKTCPRSDWGCSLPTDPVVIRTGMIPPFIKVNRVLRLLSGFVLCSFGAQADVLYSKHGDWTVAYLEVGNLNGCRATRQQTSTPIQPGNSGGPLLDISGRVVGVVVSQLNAMAMMQKDRSVPQNVNFAIQPSIVINFLSAKGVTPNLDNSSTGAQRPPSEVVADMAKKFTVQVYCQGVAPKTATGTAGTLAPSDIADFGTKFDVQATPGQGSTRP